jgi:hypothetical protein
MSGHLKTMERLDRAFMETGVEALSEALSSGRPAGVEAIASLIEETVDPDVEVDLSAWDEWPGSKTFRGIDGWFEFWREWLEPWGEFRYSRIRSEERADWLVSEVELGVRGVGSGVPVAFRFVQLWRFRDSRIAYLATFGEWDAAMDAAHRQGGG